MLESVSISSSYFLGLIFILSCAIIWAGASVLIQYIYENLNFQSPFLVTYLTNSLLTVYLPLWQLWLYLRLVKQTTTASSDDETASELSNSSKTGELFLSEMTNGDDCTLPGHQKNKEVAYTYMDVLYIALKIAPAWFIANCLYNYSLLLTSVSSSTIISNLAASFTLAFSWFYGLEDVTSLKIVGVVICFLGAVCVGLQDSQSDQGSMHTVSGDIVALLAAVGYGLYTTLIRRMVPDDNGVSMQLLLGCIGAVNAVVLSPVLLIMYLLKWDNLGKVNGTIVGFLVLSGLCDNVLSDYLWARSVLLTSPTVATIGMSITIPLAMASDAILNGARPDGTAITGALLVLLGFCMVNIDRSSQAELEAWGRRLLGWLGGWGSDSGNMQYHSVENPVRQVFEENAADS